MKIIIVRHAIAMDRVQWARDHDTDHDRTLTAKGEDRMRLGAAGLRKIVPQVDYILTSRYNRARDTARILHDSYPEAKLEEMYDLEPGGDFDNLIDKVSQYAPASVVALVGHEPDLSALMGRLLTGQNVPLGFLKKGAAVLISFYSTPQRERGNLEWALPPSALRALSPV